MSCVNVCEPSNGNSFTPIPLSNIVPALVIALIAPAYLEEDGVLLLIALLTAVIVLGTEWIIGLW